MEHFPHKFVVDSGIPPTDDNSNSYSFYDALMEDKKGIPKPGDDEFPQYKLPYFIASERMMTFNINKCSPNAIRAFTIANKATDAIEKEDFKTAKEMAYKALSYDMTCIDAWRILCKCINHFCDVDTLVCAEREVLSFARRFACVQGALDDVSGKFYTTASTRPYIRVLLDLGSYASQLDHINVAINTYEEILRLNHKDNNVARDNLLALYMKLLGRISRFPDTKPVRTFKQADELIKLRWEDEDEIFDSDDIVVRWYNMLKLYHQKGDWESEAKKENEKNSIMFEVVFGEKEIKDVQRTSMPGAYPYDPPEEVIQKGKLILDAVKDWPDFVIDCYRLLRSEPSKEFKEIVQEMAPNLSNELTQEYKQSKVSLGEKYIEKSRTSLKNMNFQNAVENCSFAKSEFHKSSHPSRRLNSDAPFAIVSNRATGAIFMEEWNLARIDTRFTLVMKPDHKRSYQKLVTIAEKFKAEQLIPEFKQLEEKSLKESNTPEDWKKMARKAIGLLSIPSLVLASQNKLTAGDKEEFMRIGIEDMYTPVNFPAKEMAILPFNKESELERAIDTK